MRIRVTLTFDNNALMAMLADGISFSNMRCERSIESIAAEFPPEVQFCGEFFKTGETKEFEVFDSYDVKGAPMFGWHDGGDKAGMATHIVGEWDAHRNHNVVHMFGCCYFTGHIWNGVPCDCNKVAANIFTPHELGAVEKEEGSIITHQGVTIAWERIKQGETNEKDNRKSDGCVGVCADGLPVTKRW